MIELPLWMASMLSLISSNLIFTSLWLLQKNYFSFDSQGWIQKIQKEAQRSETCQLQLEAINIYVKENSLKIILIFTEKRVAAVHSADP